MIDIILAATILSTPTPVPNNQQPWAYPYYDSRARERVGPETPQERARREWQERWPQMQHCRLPACSTK